MLLLRGGIHELTGCRDIAILLNDIVLDTWHRYQGCEKPGIRFLSVEFQGADPISFVLSRTLYRRHLSTSQRVQAIVECAAWKQGGWPPRLC